MARLEELVTMVSEARSTFQESRRIILDMWLLAKYPPQIIYGNRGGGR